MTCWRTFLTRLATDTLMLPRDQDFERAVAEFDHVFSRIPLHVCAGQDAGQRHVPSSGGRAVHEQLARDAGSKKLQCAQLLKQ